MNPPNKHPYHPTTPTGERLASSSKVAVSKVARRLPSWLAPWIQIAKHTNGAFLAFLYVPLKKGMETIILFHLISTYFHIFHTHRLDFRRHMYFPVLLSCVLPRPKIVGFTAAIAKTVTWIGPWSTNLGSSCFWGWICPEILGMWHPALHTRWMFKESHCKTWVSTFLAHFYDFPMSESLCSWCFLLDCSKMNTKCIAKWWCYDVVCKTEISECQFRALPRCPFILQPTVPKKGC